jgi:polar amino acid transport system substrate-binding protein
MAFPRTPIGIALLLAAVLCNAGFPRAARADDALDKIRQAGTITVGTEAAYPPYEFIKDGQIVGYDKDILDYVMGGLNKVKVNQLDVPFQGLFPGLLAGKFDLIATALTMYPDATKKFAFTIPVAEGTLSILKKNGDARIKTADDLNGKVVGVQLGTGGEKIIRALGDKMKAAGKPGFDLKLFTSTPEEFLALANGQIDASIALLPTIKTLMKNQPNVYEIAGPLQGERQFIGWAVRPDEKSLRDYINSRIKQLHDSGKLYELQDKWFGFRMEVPVSGYLPEGAE